MPLYDQARPALLACAALAGCRSIFGIDPVPVATCDQAASFGAPVELDTLATPTGEGEPRLSSDELTIYYDVHTSFGAEIYAATRATTADAFGGAIPLDAVNTIDGIPVSTNWPAPTPDGLALYFTITSHGTQIFRATRASTHASFGAPAPVGSNTDVTVYVAADDALYLASTTRGGSNTNFALYRAELAADGSYGDVVPLPGFDPMADDRAPAVTADEQTLYYCHFDAVCSVWLAARTDPDAAWSAGQPLGASAPGDQAPGWVSPDGCRLYIRQAGSDAIDHLYVLQKP